MFFNLTDFVRGEYLEALFITIATVLSLYTFKAYILLRLSSIAKKTKIDFDDLIINVLNSLGFPFYFVISLYAPFIFVLNFGEEYRVYFKGVFFAVVLFYFVKAVEQVVFYFLKKLVLGKHNGQEGVFNFLKTFSRIVIWLLAVVLYIQNLGFNVSAVVAGLGVGGIAIAFALQNILGDIFSYISIFLDKPFKKGDFIEFDSSSGVVQKVGIKTTRLKTLQGEELVVPNKALTDGLVHNYKKLKERRVVINLGLTYETDLKKLQKVKSLVKTSFKGVKNVRFDRVHFNKLGDFSLNFELVYFVLSDDYVVYMDVNEKILFNIFKVFKDEGIDFAYPTQQVYISK